MDLATIIGFIRALIGDNDAIAYIYSDDMLTVQVQWTILQLNDLGIQLDGGGGFTQSLTPKQAVTLSATTAMNVVAPQDDQFGYSVPGLSVRRSSSTNRIYSHLQNILDQANGGIFAMAVDTDIEAIINGIFRYINDVNAAFANSSAVSG